MKDLLLIRTSKSDHAIYGVLIVRNGNIVDYVCKTIENKARSFPAGTYSIQFEYSPRFKINLWELKGISGRGEIKIHVANNWESLEGCIGVGLSHQNIDSDADIEVASSKVALSELHIAMIKQKVGTIKVVDVL